MTTANRSGPSRRRAASRRSSVTRRALTPARRRRRESAAQVIARRSLTRLNKGLRRRKNRTQLGFMMDPVSGYWAKNEEEGEDANDPTVSPRQWIVPSVQDRKNALLFQPTDVELSQAALTTAQHALLRGIEAVFQLEESEILAEPMPTRDARTGFLFYEATEGGAGVLTRLVAEPERLAEVARKALAIMHFDVSSALPEAATELVDEPDTACVAACYRCVMSYYNQPDHELLDRRDEDARALLLRLARARLTGLEAVVVRRSTRPSAPPGMEPTVDGALSAWLAYARARDLPTPDREPITVDGRTVPLVWRGHYVAALFEPNAILSAGLEAQGLEVMVLGSDEAAWAEPTAALVKLLGKAS